MSPLDEADDLGDLDEAPTLRQLSVFLPNRVGALLSLTRSLDAFGLEIRAMHIVEAADYAVARMLVDRPGLAQEVLKTEGYAVFEADVLAVALPGNNNDGIRQVLSALLLTELNVHSVYTLTLQSTGTPVLAVHVEDLDTAARVLHEQDLALVGPEELE